jgi:hypothetical protein
MIPQDAQPCRDMTFEHTKMTARQLQDLIFAEARKYAEDRKGPI